MQQEEAFILHIETSTEICSVCLSRGNEIIASKTSKEPFIHTRKATLMIQDLYQDSGLTITDIQAVSVSEGPGSYTGLRVGGSIAKGICFGLNIPLIPVNTLHALGMAARKVFRAENTLYIPMIDARRMEVYMSQLDSNMHVIKANEPYILTKDSFLDEARTFAKIVFSGNGQFKFREIADQPHFIFTDIVCDARHMVSIAHNRYLNGQFIDAEMFSPNYIKPANVTKSKKKLI